MGINGREERCLFGEYELWHVCRTHVCFTYVQTYGYIGTFVQAGLRQCIFLEINYDKMTIIVIMILAAV